MNNKRIRYLTVLVMALVLLFTSGCGCARVDTVQEDAQTRNMEAGTEGAAEQAAEPEVLLPEELIVGNTTAMRGDFFSDVFGNSTSDIDVRTLIHGFDLVNWDQGQDEYTLDPTVVSHFEVTEDANKNRVYELTLCDDLKFSDGTKITAKDYAFSLLLRLSPQLQEIGGTVTRSDHLLGGRAYAAGESSVLAGVRLLDDNRLSITLNREYLPFYYEEALLLCNPYPISVIAPGCTVKDDGDGVYIEGDFTAEVLRQTILDPVSGYNSHPSVTSGPYVLKSFDGTTAHFESNSNYKGTWVADEFTLFMDEDSLTRAQDEEGNELILARPSIEKIEFTLADNATAEKDLAEGRLHVLNKATSGPVIENLLENGDMDYELYDRVGLSFITFSFEYPAVREAAVRQAIAWCMDRDQMTKDYCGEEGTRVDGYYGIGQWEYQTVTGQAGYPVLKGYEEDDREAAEPDGTERFQNRYARSEDEYKQMIKQWKALTLDGLTEYKVDTKKANDLLDQAGWTLNANGEPRQAGSEEIRCKMVDGELVALDLKLMLPAGSRMAETLTANAVPNLKACGIGLTLVEKAMPELLSEYYRQSERSTEMIFLGSNYAVPYDPAVTVSAETEEGRRQWNTMYSDDADLYRLADDLRRTEPDDMFMYMKKWILFQERFNTVLPAIPVYSNTYYDFFIPQLKGYRVNAHTTWAQAIVGATLSAD